MKGFENLYLVRLFRQNKLLFLFVFLFICGQQYFCYKDNSTFPWFVWSMYSHDEYLPKTAAQTEVFIDGKRLDISSIPIWQEATIIHTFNKYLQVKNNLYIDPLDEVVKKRTANCSPAWRQYIASCVENHQTNTDKYPVWIKQYLETNVVKHSIHRIEFREVQYTYENSLFKQTDSARTLLKIGA